MTTLLLNKAHYPVTVLGPGRRAGIWTQGCTIGCSGCVSQDTWPADASTALEVSSVLGWLTNLAEEPEGVTISGGEPFQQPEALRELLLGIHAWRRDRPIDVLVYTGYTLSHVERSAELADLLPLCDAVISGPYIDRLNQGNKWRGSSNQILTTFTDLGSDKYSDAALAAAETADATPAMQVSVVGGHVYYIGIPRRADMARLEKKLHHAGINHGAVSWLS